MSNIRVSLTKSGETFSVFVGKDHWRFDAKTLRRLDGARDLTEDELWPVMDQMVEIQTKRDNLLAALTAV